MWSVSFWLFGSCFSFSPKLLGKSKCLEFLSSFRIEKYITLIQQLVVFSQTPSGFDQFGDCHTKQTLIILYIVIYIYNYVSLIAGFGGLCGVDWWRDC